MKYVYIVLGVVSVGLAGIGVVLPILPTVPFLLFSAFCFARSSEKLNIWLKNTKLYRENLESYVEKKAMTTKTKLRIITTVTIVMAFAFVMMRNVFVPRIILFVVWAFHIIYFTFFVKTLK